MGSLLRIGHGDDLRPPDRDAATMSLAGGGSLFVAVAPSAIGLRRRLDAHLAQTPVDLPTR
jgi:hypothetical protein